MGAEPGDRIVGEKETATAEDLAGGDTERLKGLKSNSSERSTVQDFEKNTEAARATTVKSGKSNSSDRLGNEGGGSADATTVKSSKSNSSE